MRNEGFKIIAIKPLKGCSSEYRKLLQEERIYYFYNNYNIDKHDRISVRDVVPTDFYKVNNTSINISAIVGKNGSGKSTLIELLFRVINNLAQRQEKIKAIQKYIPGLSVDLYFETDTYYKVRVSKSTIKVFKYNGEALKAELQPDEFRLNEFFYTIAVNYSHYAYNSKDFNDKVNWIDNLFHKNDGYQTPLVINPLRKEGNIDINNENHLVKTRLIANLLRPANKEGFSFRHLTDKLEATSLKLTLNNSKRDTVLYELKHSRERKIEKVTIKDLNLDSDVLLRRFNKLYSFRYNKEKHPNYQIAYDYILYKLVSIAIKYEEYSEYFFKPSKQFDSKKFTEFIRKLKQDESHITFKLKQTINFLRHPYADFINQDVELDHLSDLILSRARRLKKRIDIIEFVPPPIFKIDILLKAKDGTGEEILFRSLSSGEKQMVYSTSSLLYHLVNLNSITNTEKRIGYKYVNIVLEEIELYFHPEMQRVYINHILECISRLELKKIKGINFCFVTHSPFILSDIPNSNILFLKDNGRPEEDAENIKTFGGNIHELLADVFFLNNGFIGEFAKKKIQTIINSLKTQEKDSKIKRETLYKEIELIGEPFLKEKLLELYYRKYDKQKRVAELKAEIKRLELHD